MSLLAGLDISGKALHAALIPADPDDTTLPPVTFRVVELPRFKPGSSTAQHRSVERCRVIRDAVHTLLDVAHDTDYADVTSVWVEEPMGARNKATNVLREIYGAVLASIPSHIERASIAPQEWRRVLLERDFGAGVPAKWSKVESVCMAEVYLDEWGVAWERDEHHAEALLVALAGRHLTWQHIDTKGGAAA